MSEIIDKKTFYINNAVVLTTLECFINNSDSYTVNYVTKKHKKFQKKLLNILNNIPDHDEFDDVRKKIIQWHRSLHNLKQIAKKCESGNTLMKSLDGFEIVGKHGSISDLFYPKNISPIKSQSQMSLNMNNESPRVKNKQKNHVHLIESENSSDNAESYMTEKSPPKKKKKKNITHSKSPSTYMSSPSNKSPSPKMSLQINVEARGKSKKNNEQKLEESSVESSENDEIVLAEKSPSKKKKNMTPPPTPPPNLSPPPFMSPLPNISISPKITSPRGNSKNNQMSESENSSDSYESDSCIDDSTNNNNRIDLSSIDFGIKQVVEKNKPEVQIKKYSVSKKVTVAEFSALLQHSLNKSKNYHGFKMHSQSDLFDFEVVTCLVRRRELLLKKFLEARNNGEKPDEMSKEELLKLYTLAQERLIEQYKLIALNYHIEKKVKPLSDLMTGVHASNTSTAKNYYAINGNVKSLTKVVLHEDQLPHPFLIFCLYIQHVILFGITYGKTGISMCHNHNNNKSHKSTLYCERYLKHEKNYNRIDETTIMFVGRYDLIQLIEPVAIKISGGAGVLGNSPRDFGNKNNQTGNYNSLGLLYFTGVKHADPFEVFLFRCTPIIKMDSTAMILFAYLSYMNAKGINLCPLCAKIVKHLASHIQRHARMLVDISPDNFKGFLSYHHFAVTIMSRAKEFFKIKDLTSYIKSLDKISNDVHAISSVFNSIGVINLKNGISSFKNIQKNAYHNVEQNYIIEDNRIPIEVVKIKNVDKSLRSFISSKDFELSFTDTNF